MAAMSPLRVANILIYNGKGADFTSSKALFEQYSLHVSKKYSVLYTTEKELQANDWVKSTKLLIMGGGAPTEWIKALGDDTLKKIQRYVFEGGSFCGFCAGAYFASEISIFQDKKVIRPYPLFSGQAMGPIFHSSENFLYPTPQIAKATKVSLVGTKEETGNLFYLGGPSFIPNNKKDTTVLATFCGVKLPLPAIIRHIYGKGTVVLSGVHPEFSGKDHDLGISDDLPLKNIIQTLQQSESFRLKTLHTILQASQVTET
jgi:biotin---protein ligase